MDTMTVNKLVAALLVGLLVAKGVAMLSEGPFHVEAPETPAYAVALPESEGGGDDAAPEPADEGPTFAALLADASADRGQRSFGKCMACHSVNPADGNKIGPNLADVVGAAVAHRGDFNYSGALAGHGGTWSYELLDAWLADPRAAIPGNKMAFAGISREQERADLIAFLRANTDNPPPLPEN